LAVGFTQHVFIDPQGRPVSYGKKVFEVLKEKGLIKEGDASQGKNQEEELSTKLRKLIVEREEGGSN